jgi:hypothetical protein
VLNVGLELFMEGPDVSNIYKYITYVTFLPVEVPSHGDVYRYSSRHKEYNKILGSIYNNNRPGYLKEKAVWKS